MIKEYIAEKLQTLEDFGLNNSIMLEELFKDKIKDLTSEEKMEVRIDQVCHDILKKYLCEGDRTYILKKADVQNVYDTLKKRYDNCETLYEDAIVSLIGKHGLMLLKKHHMIESCASLDGRKLYAI